MLPKRNFSSFSIEYQFVFPEPLKRGYKFLGWFYNNKRVYDTTRFEENITLYARYECRLIVLQENTSTFRYHIYYDYSVIDLLNLNNDKEQNYTILNNVNSVRFISSSKKTFTSFSIYVESRTASLTLFLDNLRFTAPNNKTAIDAKYGRFLLRIDVEGIAIIKGADGTNGRDGRDGKNAVELVKGENGYNGLSGADGMNAINVYEFELARGVLDVYGGNGGHGGNGGDSGYSSFPSNVLLSNYKYTARTPGKGGVGGEGGNGGKYGTSQNGSNGSNGMNGKQN